MLNGGCRPPRQKIDVPATGLIHFTLYKRPVARCAQPKTFPWGPGRLTGLDWFPEPKGVGEMLKSWSIRPLAGNRRCLALVGVVLVGLVGFAPMTGGHGFDSAGPTDSVIAEQIAQMGALEDSLSQNSAQSVEAAPDDLTTPRGILADLVTRGMPVEPVAFTSPARTHGGMDALAATRLDDARLDAGFGGALQGLDGAATLKAVDLGRNEEWRCLTEALYFEARGETMTGQMAVAEVILNRVDSKRYPGTVCAVTAQGSERRNACQFSYMCDGKPEDMDDARAMRRVAAVARVMLDGRERTLTGGATHYHTDAVHPGWASRLTRTNRIGYHIFYRRPQKLASN